MIGQAGRLARHLVMILAVGLPLGLVLAPSLVRAQDVEEYYAKMLEKEVEVVDPVKRPEIGLTMGLLNFMGDVQYSADNPLLGNWAASFSIGTLLGKARQVKLVFSFMYGRLQGEDFGKSFVMNTENLPIVDESPWRPNSAFRSEIIQFAITSEYNFWHLIGKKKAVRPYVSLGVGVLTYGTKLNYRGADGNFYHYWSDGAVRQVEEPVGGTSSPPPAVKVDESYETDFQRVNPFQLSKILPVTVVFPVEVGLDLYLSDRIYLRLFSSVNYPISDLIDGFDRHVAERYATLSDNGYHDLFMYTGLSLHLDLFSQKESYILDSEFADIKDFDYEVFLADEDNDGVLDHMDDCPETPEGVVVDSVGCPLDRDGDGVPDHLDQQIDSPADAVVDAQGVALSRDQLIIPHDIEAVARDKVKLHKPSRRWSRQYTFEGEGIPPKFASLDSDLDGYISYEEVIHAVDSYFSGESTLTSDDIYELNAFFFTQK